MVMHYRSEVESEWKSNPNGAFGSDVKRCQGLATTAGRVTKLRTTYHIIELI